MAEYEITQKQQVLDRLGISDWRYLTQDHYMDLYAMLEKMDPATRAFVQKGMFMMASNSLKKQQEAASIAIVKNSEITIKTLDVSRSAIKALDDIAASDMSEEQKDKHADRIMKIHADAMQQAEEARDSNNEIVQALARAAVFALVAAAGYIGIPAAAKLINNRSN